MKIITVVAIAGAAALVLSPHHRARVRRFVSRRIIDRDARDAVQEEERWDDDGGATGATTEETVG